MIPLVIPFLAALLEALGVAAEDAELWSVAAPKLIQMGSAVGLSLEINPATWTTTYAQAQPVIVGVQPLLDSVAATIAPMTIDAEGELAFAPTTFADNYLIENNPSLIEAALGSGATLSDSSAANGNAVLIGQSDTVINAGDGGDLIVGGVANPRRWPAMTQMKCAA